MSESAVSRFLAETPGWQPEKPYIVINPNASDLLLERRWPTESVLEAIHRLVSLGNQIVLIGAPNEAGFVQSLFDKSGAGNPGSRLEYRRTAELGELLALLQGSACVLTNDTGPMHMAIALERPTVCLFGPANPEHYGQDLPYVDIFYAQVFCSPCLYEADEPPCNGNNVCMQQIKPEAVVEAVQYLARTGLPRRNRQREPFLDSLPILADSPDGRLLGVVERASLGRVKESDERDLHDGNGSGSSEAHRSFLSQVARAAGIRETNGIWIARAVIVGVAAALAWYTWGHWGDFQIDNGRELYVPAEILKGKMLFRDLWYMYGPLAPVREAVSVPDLRRAIDGAVRFRTGADDRYPPWSPLKSHADSISGSWAARCRRSFF